MKLPLKILIHSIFWLVFILFSIVVSFTPKPGNWPVLSELTPHFLINCIWAAAIFYLSYIYFFRYFEKRLLVKYLILSVSAAVVITFSFLFIHKIFFNGFNVFNYKFFAPPIAGSFIIGQCGCLVKGFETWFANIQVKSELENRNLKNELELLKSQVNPHFLFNTLNNIDSLIQKSPADASSALITLSDMLRYMIYETNAESVSLGKEIRYLKNFVKLQQLRFRESDYVRTTFPDDCNDIQIAPVLFIPFVENAFKYSVSNGKFPVIDLSILCKNKILKFECSNYFSVEPNKHDRTGGVGLENVKRRLELLYPKKHSLHISNENSIFKIVLSIELTQ